MTFNELLALDEEREKKGTGASNRDSVVSRGRDAAIPSATGEGIGKAVARVGKEATTHRLTRAEKEALAEIIYTYRQKGWRTSENEIVRIGINWLLADHAKGEEGSMLQRVLQALQEVKG